VKITTLLTQYLYAKHRLDLPGLGSFILDPTLADSSENSKQRNSIAEGITFENKPSLKESPDLIAYISAESGKMKALASSDLDSHLELAQQFLNIGKPFTFEGIGTLVKLKAGEYGFVPLATTSERSKSYTQKETPKQPKEDSFLSTPRTKMGWQRPVVALLILCGLALAIWGGYAISKNASGKTEETAADKAEIVPATDTTALVAVDTTAPKQVAQMDQSNYKYVLEVSQSKRAFKRYKQLKTNQWDVKLETTDSIQYKLFLLLPAIAADSTRVLDSLTAMTGKRVYIEHQN
jgi:hypothetical protein